MRYRWIAALLTSALLGCGGSASVVTVVVTVMPPTATPNAAATATRASELAQLATALAPTPIPTSVGRIAVGSAPAAQGVAPAVATPPAASTLTVIAQGYGQNDRDIGYAFIVENSDAKSAVDSTQFRVSAFDAAGQVVRTETNYIAVLFPGQRLGIAGGLYLPQSGRIVNVDFALSPGRARPFAGVSPLGAEMVRFQGDPLSGALVTGVVRSALAQELTNVSVSAIAYDERGVIVGGGHKMLERVPASGQAAIEVPVTVTGRPARVEMYPTISLQG